MTQPLGEEFIRVRPDASTFRTELETQIAAAMQGVSAQVAAAQAQVGRAAAAAVAPGVMGGVSTLPNVRLVTSQTSREMTAAAAATTKLGGATQATGKQLKALSGEQLRAVNTTKALNRDIQQAETAAGRYSRGMIAATAASTGFFRAVSFASGAFLVGAAIGATIGAAVNEFSAMTTVGAQTAQIIKATGGAANVTAQQIDALAQRSLALTGVDDELVKQAANVLLCLEASAEALTRRRGWRRHDELVIGDEILTYDPEDDTTRWEPILDFYRYEVETELIRWRSKQIDVATTPHHRWWTSSIGEHDAGYRFRTTEEIGGHQVKVKIGGGQPACFADDRTYSDELVELAAWVFTEGTVNWLRPSTPNQYGVTITQSEAVNPYQVARIRGLTARLRAQGHEIGESSETRASGSGICSGIAVMPRTQISWRFGKSLGKAIKSMLPAKRLTPELFNSLTREQAELFLDTLILGDGHVDRNGHRQFIQKDEEQLGMVAMLAAMLGIRTSVLGRGDALYFCVSEHLYGNSVHEEPEPYVGIVWCPQVRTQIFLARNRGRTFWTGNTFRAIRNEVGAGNDVFNRAVKATLDISSVFRTDLRGSAVQLGKALQDPVRGVTALRRSGITLSQGQRDLIKEMVRSGRILSAQKLILGEVERQVGGTAEAIGKTLPGQLRIMREQAVNTLGEYVKRLSESKTASDLLADASKGLAQTFGAIRSVIAAVGPALVNVAQGFSRIVNLAGGAGALLAVAAAYKGVTLAAGAATRAQALYITASAGAAQADLARALAAGTVTAKLEANAAAELTAARAAQRSMGIMVALSGAFALAAAAGGQWQLALVAGGIAVAGFALKVRAAMVAMRAATGAATLMGGVMAALGGPIGAAAIGLGVLALAMFKLKQRADNLPGSFNAAKRALDDLNKSIEDNMRLRAAVGTARERVGVAGFDVRAAERDLQRAQEQLANTRAQPGSLEARFLADQVRVAEENLAKAHDRLRQAEIDLDRAREEARVGEQGRPGRIARITKEMQQQITTLRALHAAQPDETELTRAFMALGQTFSQAQRSARTLREEQFQNSVAGQRTIAAVAERFRDLAEKETGASRKAAVAIATIAEALNRLPTEKEIAIIVRLAERGAGVNQILRRIGVITGTDNEQRRLQEKSSRGVTASLREQYLQARATFREEQKKLKTIRDELATRRQAKQAAADELANAKDAVESAREGRAAAIEGLADAQRGLADAHQNLTDVIRQSHESIAEAIRSSREALNQSIQDAKGNLQDLGQSIAEALGRFSEAGGAGADNLSERFKTLRDQIIRGGGGALSLKAAQQVNFALSAKAPEVSIDKIKQQFTDLVDSFSRGLIKLPEFNRRTNALLSGLDLRQFAQRFGTGAANELKDQIRTFRQQAVLNAKIALQIGNTAGGAIAQKLVNPLKTLAEGQRAIADARRQAARDISNAERNLADSVRAVQRAETDIAKANRQLVAAERRLRAAQTKATQANTRAQNQSAKETKQLRIVLQAKKALLEVKPKPKGDNSFKSLVYAPPGPY